MRKRYAPFFEQSILENVQPLTKEHVIHFLYENDSKQIVGRYLIDNYDDLSKWLEEQASNDVQIMVESLVKYYENEGDKGQAGAVTDSTDRHVMDAYVSIFGDEQDREMARENLIVAVLMVISEGKMYDRYEINSLYLNDDNSAGGIDLDAIESALNLSAGNQSLSVESIESISPNETVVTVRYSGRDLLEKKAVKMITNKIRKILPNALLACTTSTLEKEIIQVNIIVV